MNASRLFFDSAENPSARGAKAITWIVLALGFSLLCWTLLIMPLKNWDTVWKYRLPFWHGWLMTIGVSIAALGLSTLIGVVAALARRSSMLVIRIIATIYIEFVRGMPLLVILLIGFYVVADRMNINDRVPVGIVLLSLFSGAYIAEMVRAGIESVGASQRESARAIGLTPLQTYRFVIFPQALRQTLPPLAGQFASLIKDSSLLMVLGISEFTFSAQQVNSETYSTLECYLLLAPGYLILTLPIIFLSRRLEKKFRYET